MPTKAAVVAIGIDRTGVPLPKLRAAAQGAEEVAQWARDQGMDVVCLTDALEPQTLARIQKCVRDFVDKGIYEQLIIYFSGHGLLRAPGAEVWLLSHAPDVPSEAVNVVGSIWNARNSGIPHVVFISDACRTLPTDLRFSQVVGGEIFPSLNPRIPRPEIDSFYATLPGDPALEANPDDAVASHRGVFTHCLVQALGGHIGDVIEAHGDEPERWVVRSRRLKNWLIEAVPEAAAAIDIQLVQYPDVQVESASPTYLSVVPTPKDTPRGGARAIRPAIPSEIASKYAQKIEFVRKLEGLGRLGTQRVSAALSPQIAQLREARGRPQFETHTGFTLIGASVQAAQVTAGGFDLLLEANQSTHVRIHSVSANIPSQLLVRFEDGNGAGMAILPGYVGTVLVGSGRVLNVNYVPARNTAAYADYEPIIEEVEARKAFVAAAARNGLFRVVESAFDPLQFLRMGRVFDYTLALYTAYAYAQTGNVARLQEIHALLATAPGPMPFDIALLAGELERTTVSPAWPMLSQGWTLMGDQHPVCTRAAREVSPYLVPGLWTTFKPEALALLWTASKTDATTEESR